MITQRVVLVRGDTRVIDVVSSPVSLSAADSVRFTARDEDDAIVWEKSDTDGIDVLTATTATITIDTDDWTAWETAGEPERMDWDVQVTTAGAPRTIVIGTFRVIPDASR